MQVLQEVPYKPQTLRLLIDGEWVESSASEHLPVMNPATGEVTSKVPFATEAEVDRAVASAELAFEKWRNVPISERVQYLFKMKHVLEAHLEDFARINTQNHGKTVVESRGDVRRAVENVEAAIGAAYTLMKGEKLDQIAPGVDEETVKEPLGVFAVICPFNFPTMVPFWYMPYAIVLGCTVVVKPSEVTPLPMTYVAEFLQRETQLPAGVLNLVHGSRATSEALIRHSSVKGVTFVGSTPVGRAVYKLAGEYGKRAIVQAGAKNAIIVMPDANLPHTIEACISSFFGNTGQRCLAGANLLVTEEIHDTLVEKFANAAGRMRLGYGLDEATEMGPLVSEKAKQRVLKYVDTGVSEGGKMVLDGRGARVPNYEKGFFVGATVFDDISVDMTIAREEIFGPVASVMKVANLDEAIELINKNTEFGNAASIFTGSGHNAREFRRRVQAGNIGINVGVAAPVGYFPFAGMRQSFFGVLHGQMESIDFFTDRKVIISRWNPP
ncbi:MAG TPA: CoA-acylating methylmalonate-semialdehyde dehydrogenase [archaeon]|nr:CoA-acylating methylmalonate-semialdehyde dehydrogenase [Candidatus Dormibacteraeota bacterium]HYB84831.1 CoA-acylating methylmalonate-semialdehyde dehydrogenase [archaeon]